MPLKGGIAPIPFVTRSTTSAFGGFDWSRLGPTVPVVPASARVWQPPQFAVKIPLPSAAWPSPGGGGAATGLACDGCHVRRHVVDVVAGHEVGGHAGRTGRGGRDGKLDLPRDDLLERALLEALLTGGREGVVEIRADRARGARRGERVTAAALLLEQLLAADGVSAGRDAAGTRLAAAGREVVRISTAATSELRTRASLTLGLA